MRRWQIKFTPTVIEQLAVIKDTRIKESIHRHIDRLQTDPDKQGKLLDDDLTGYRSVRAVGQRYRIIYKLENEQIVVLVVMIGIRKEGDKKDVYALANKLARLGLLDQ